MQMLAQYKLTCEAPSCLDLAAFPYWNDYVFVFLCSNCMVKTATRSFTRSLQSHMLAEQLKKSYVQSNLESGFQLEKDLVSRAEDEKKIIRKEKSRIMRENRELRAVFEGTGGKVGMPEEALLLARARKLSPAEKAARVEQILPEFIPDEIPFSDRSFF